MANFISISRIIMSLLLILYIPTSLEFTFLYLAAGLSDILDGYIARLTETRSKLGARLDSFADLIFLIVVLTKILPILRISSYIILFMILIASIKLVSLIICKIKFNHFAFIHTLSSKATGFIVFIYYFFISSNLSRFYLYIICSIALISAGEELLIHINSNKLDLDRESLWSE